MRFIDAMPISPPVASFPPRKVPAHGPAPVAGLFLSLLACFFGLLFWPAFLAYFFGPESIEMSVTSKTRVLFGGIVAPEPCGP